jgi:hypothetical protein
MKHRISSVVLIVVLASVGTRAHDFWLAASPDHMFADTGELFTGIDRDQALEIARRYAPGYPGPIRYAAYLTEPDQWTLQARAEMPMHRFALDDAEATHLYGTSW